MASGVVVDLKDVKISPNNCPLTSPLELQLSFVVSESVANGSWKFSFMVDMANKRRIIELGISEAASYNAGDLSTVKFSIDAIDVTGFKPHQLANTGLLLGLCCFAYCFCRLLLPLLTLVRSLFDARGSRDSAGNAHHYHDSKQPFTIFLTSSTEFLLYCRFLWLLRWKMTAASFVETCSVPWSKCCVHMDTGRKVMHEYFSYQSLSLKSIFLGKLFVRIVATLWRELLPLLIASLASSAASEARASSKCLRCSIPCTNH
jgi:hypothetical protein